MNTAPIVKDYSDHGPDQVRSLPHLPAFTGVAMSTRPHASNRLYVADFQNSTIRVFDNQWQDITAEVAFARPAGMPSNFSPYNIQSFAERLSVASAAVDVDAEEPALATSIRCTSPRAPTTSRTASSDGCVTPAGPRSTATVRDPNPGLS